MLRFSTVTVQFIFSLLKKLSCTTIFGRLLAGCGILKGHHSPRHNCHQKRKRKRRLYFSADFCFCTPFSLSFDALLIYFCGCNICGLSFPLCVVFLCSVFCCPFSFLPVHQYRLFCVCRPADFFEHLRSKETRSSFYYYYFIIYCYCTCQLGNWVGGGGGGCCCQFFLSGREVINITAVNFFVSSPPLVCHHSLEWLYF